MDVVLNGHVHAFERTFAVYDFVRDDCGPVHLSMGDGGNIEKLNAVFADSPGHCPGWPERGPSYQPDSCPQKLYHGDYCSPVQPAWSAIRCERGRSRDRRRGMRGPKSRPPSSACSLCITVLCPRPSPAASHEPASSPPRLRREPTFGHAILDVLNDTHARFQWKRNMDPAKGAWTMQL